MSNSKELHIASKEIVSKYGEAVIGTPQFKNLLADYGAFKDIPATKQILIDLQNAGFGTYLYELKQTNDTDILKKCYSHRQEFLSEGKYREDITIYVYSSMLYALGLIEDVSEPKVKNPFSADKGAQEKKAEKRTVQHIDLGKMSELLKDDYLKLLEQIVIPDPSSEGQASGFFTTSTRTKLLVIEEKLRIIGERVNRDYLSWCSNQKDKALGKYFKNEKEQQRKLLDSLKRKYLDTFDSYHKPTEKKWKGYFDEATLSLQKELETDIRYLCSYLGEDKDWCSNKKTKFYLERKIAEKKRKNIFISACIAIGTVIVICGITIFTYLSSSNDRSQYGETYAMAEAASNKGDYVKAIDLYNQAGDNYSAFWNNSSYKHQAHEGAVAASNKIFNKDYQTIQQAINDADYISAYLAIKSLPTNLVLEDDNQEKLQSAKTLIESNLETAIKSELDNLIDDIYTTKGNLSESALQRLDQLLTVDSNNYWLNFIKAKHNE
jgi:hypothetical protein